MDSLSFQGSHYLPPFPTLLSAVVYISLNTVSTLFFTGKPLEGRPLGAKPPRSRETLELRTKKRRWKMSKGSIYGKEKKGIENGGNLVF